MICLKQSQFFLRTMSSIIKPYGAIQMCDIVMILKNNHDRLGIEFHR